MNVVSGDKMVDYYFKFQLAVKSQDGDGFNIRLADVMRHYKVISNFNLTAAVAF